MVITSFFYQNNFSTLQTLNILAAFAKCGLNTKSLRFHNELNKSLSEALKRMPSKTAASKQRARTSLMSKSRGGAQVDQPTEDMEDEENQPGPDGEDQTDAEQTD